MKVFIGSSNGFSTVWYQAINLTNDDLLSIGLLGTNLNEIWIKIELFIHANALENVFGGHFVQDLTCSYPVLPWTPHQAPPQLYRPPRSCRAAAALVADAPRCPAEDTPLPWGTGTSRTTKIGGAWTSSNAEIQNTNWWITVNLRNTNIYHNAWTEVENYISMTLHKTIISVTKWGHH